MIKTFTIDDEKWRVVPVSALDWLHGLGEDFEQDRKGNFWWRSKFRELCKSAPQPEQVESEPVGWYDGETGWLGKRKGGEHWQPVFTHPPADNKPVESEPVGYFEQEYVGGPVLFYQVNYSEKDRPGVIPLYTTPQPGRAAELEAETAKLKLDLLTSYGESEELSGKVAELEKALKVARDALKSIRYRSIHDEPCDKAIAKINEVLNHA